MLIIVREPHEQVVALVRALDGTASVGPTADSGWTGAWWEDVRDLVGGTALASPHVVLDVTRDEVRLLVAPDGGDAVELRWAHGDGEPRGDVAAVSHRLSAVFGTPEQDRARLEDWLGLPQEGPEDVLEDLAEVLDLPELQAPPPDRGVVLHPGDPAGVRLAAAIAGPASLLRAGDGWTAVAPREDGIGPEHLAMAVSTGGGRTERTILLWRRGVTSAVQVWSRGRLEVEWAWNDTWTFVGSNPLEFETPAVEALTRAVGHEVHAPTLRSILRRRETTEDPLGELATVLGLPAEVVTFLDEPTALADAIEVVQRQSATRALLHQVRTTHTEPVSPRFRALYAGYAVATVLAASGSIAMAGLGVGIVATDGAIIGQPGATGEDVAWSFAFLALSALLVPTAVHRARRAWASRRADDDAG